MENGIDGNGSFCLFSANGKRKQQISVCLLQMEMEHGHCSAHKTVKMLFFSQREDDEQTGISNFSSTVSM
jgi:hypothetical protein